MARGRIYQVGPFSIERGAWGIDHGLCWGAWRDKQLVADFNTLKAARRFCNAILFKEGLNHEDPG